MIANQAQDQTRKNSFQSDGHVIGIRKSSSNKRGDITKFLSTIEQKISSLMAQYHRQQKLNKAIQRTMTQFSQRHPRWADSLLDGYLLKQSANRLLNGKADSITLAQTWTRQMTYQDETKRQKHITELTPITAELLTLFNQELGEVAA